MPFQLVQITAQYSNAVLLAVLPYISDFAHKLSLPVQTPITPAQIVEFRCDPRKGQTGGLLILTNGFCFSFIDGHVSSYRSPKSYFSLQDPELIPQFYGPVKVKEREALKIARGVIKKLGYADSSFHAELPPQVTKPEKNGTNCIARYRFQWLDPDWRGPPVIPGAAPALLDVEVDASTGQIHMLSLASQSLRRPPPRVDVAPPPARSLQQERQKQLSGGMKTDNVSASDAAAFLRAILPQLSSFAEQAGLSTPLPLSTNNIDAPRYFCGTLQGDPIAQVYLKNGDRFNYEHGRVTAFYAYDAYHKFPDQGRLQDFIGKNNMGTNEAIALCEHAIKKLGFKAALPRATLGTVTHLGGQEVTRCVFYWFRPGEQSNFATVEVDMQKRAIKSIYLDDPSLWRDPPKISVHPPVLAGPSQSQPTGGTKVPPVMPDEKQSSVPRLSATPAPTNDFIQGELRITPPVRRLDFAVLEDGGSEVGTVKDAKGRTFRVFIDYRLGTATPGAVYLNGRPGEPGTVRITNAALSKRLLSSENAEPPPPISAPQFPPPPPPPVSDPRFLPPPPMPPSKP